MTRSVFMHRRLRRLDLSILALGPIVYWKTDETTGTSAADATGNGHTGTYSGLTLGHTPSPITSDPSTFYVTETSGAHITSAASTAFDTSKFSFLGWVRPASGGANQIFGGVILPFNAAIRWYFYCQSDRSIHLDSNTAGLGSATTAVTFGSWNFVTVTFDDSGSGTSHLYVNGASVGSGSGQHLTGTSTNCQFNAMGNPLGGNDVRGDGTNFALFDKVLSAGDIADLYAVATS